MRLCLLFLIAVGTVVAAGQRRATLAVSAVVPAAARIEVNSPAAVTVRVTLYPNTQALVWAASDRCEAPREPKVLPRSGVHQLVFTPEEVAGKNLFCLVSTDGAVRASQYVNVTNRFSK